MNEITEIKKILEDHEKRIKALEKSSEESETSEEIQTHQVAEGPKTLAEKANVAEENVNKIYDLEKNTLTITKIIGADDREKTKNAALLILLGYKYLFSKIEVLSQEIRRNVAENRIPINNFATYLKEITPSLIRNKGKVRSPKTTYKLTILGEANARDLLKRICEE